MSNNKNINVAELDFDSIKSNLKTFLRGQDTFQDYDFDGSGLSVLLDVLAYNTHYQGIYNNLAVNEMFLDSARKRNSVVSLSKMLGYTPRSAYSSQAIVNITVTTTGLGPSILTIPAGKLFNTTVNGITYTFYNRDNITSSGPSTVYTFSDVVIIEGKPLSFSYNVTAGSKFIIPNQYTDLSTLNVRVQESASSSYIETYALAGSIVDITADSKVYWVKEIDNGLYELTFGDGNIGKSVVSGNIVHIDYFVSSLDAPNGAKVFIYGDSAVIPNSQLTVATTSPASGGSAPEDIDSIRFNAPKAYSAQNRAVTPGDYTALIYEYVPSAKSVSVWGGEDNIPPVYGKTFICIKPVGADLLTTQQKNDILSTILSSRNIVSITPIILDPEYIDIEVSSSVYYNSRETVRAASDIETIVKDSILNYDANELQKFDSVFRQSKLSRIIDTSEPSIVSNITTISLRRKINPKYNFSAEYSINIINPIYSNGVPEDAVISTGFYIKGSSNIHYLVDDGLGNIQLFYKSASGGSRIIVNPTIGTVNYAAGKINIKNLNITGIADAYFQLNITPQSYDVVSAFTQIAQIAQDKLSVSVIDDNTSTGDLRGGTNYIFTSSRS